MLQNSLSEQSKRMDRSSQGRDTNNLPSAFAEYYTGDPELTRSSKRKQTETPKIDCLKTLISHEQTHHEPHALKGSLKDEQKRALLIQHLICEQSKNQFEQIKRRSDLDVETAINLKFFFNVLEILSYHWNLIDHEKYSYRLDDYSRFQDLLNEIPNKVEKGSIFNLNTYLLAIENRLEQYIAKIKRAFWAQANVGMQARLPPAENKSQNDQRLLKSLLQGINLNEYAFAASKLFLAFNEVIKELNYLRNLVEEIKRRDGGEGLKPESLYLFASDGIYDVREDKFHVSSLRELVMKFEQALRTFEKTHIVMILKIAFKFENYFDEQYSQTQVLSYDPSRTQSIRCDSVINSGGGGVGGGGGPNLHSSGGNSQHQANINNVHNSVNNNMKQNMMGKRVRGESSAKDSDKENISPKNLTYNFNQVQVSGEKSGFNRNALTNLSNRSVTKDIFPQSATSNMSGANPLNMINSNASITNTNLISSNQSSNVKQRVALSLYNSSKDQAKSRNLLPSESSVKSGKRPTPLNQLSINPEGFEKDFKSIQTQTHTFGLSVSSSSNYHMSQLSCNSEGLYSKIQDKLQSAHSEGISSRIGNLQVTGTKPRYSLAGGESLSHSQERNSRGSQPERDRSGMRTSLANALLCSETSRMNRSSVETSEKRLDCDLIYDKENIHPSAPKNSKDKVKAYPISNSITSSDNNSLSSHTNHHHHQHHNNNHHHQHHHHHQNNEAAATKSPEELDIGFIFKNQQFFRAGSKVTSKLLKIR